MIGNDLSPKPIKFLCSYGGRILPRYPDSKLRYHGGETRVLSVERSISFKELVLKLAEMCGTEVSLRCQLPAEDLDALVSITSDEDLANLIEEYERAAAPCVKIRGFLSGPKKVSPPPPMSPKSPFVPPRCHSFGGVKLVRHAWRPAAASYGKSRQHQANGGRVVYLIHSGNNYWQ